VRPRAIEPHAPLSHHTHADAAVPRPGPVPPAISGCNCSPAFKWARSARAPLLLRGRKKKQRCAHTHRLRRRRPHCPGTRRPWHRRLHTAPATAYEPLAVPGERPGRLPGPRLPHRRPFAIFLFLRGGAMRRRRASAESLCEGVCGDTRGRRQAARARCVGGREDACVRAWPPSPTGRDEARGCGRCVKGKREVPWRDAPLARRTLSKTTSHHSTFRAKNKNDANNGAATPSTAPLDRGKHRAGCRLRCCDHGLGVPTPR
jgi:hypothetical protein